MIINQTDPNCRNCTQTCATNSNCKNNTINWSNTNNLTDPFNPSDLPDEIYSTKINVDWEPIKLKPNKEWLFICIDIFKEFHNNNFLRILKINNPLRQIRFFRKNFMQLSTFQNLRMA